MTEPPLTLGPADSEEIDKDQIEMKLGWFFRIDAPSPENIST